MKKILFILLSITLGLSLINAYTETEIMLEMSDGVKLATDIFKPLQTGVYPTVVIRTPYGKENMENPILLAYLTNSRLYNVVVQDTRGRNESEGVDSVFFGESWEHHMDGYETIQWAAEQEWSTGDIGTWGASALGINQLISAGCYPPNLKCCFVMVAASNIYGQAAFQQGAYRESLVDGWITQEMDADYILPLIYENHLYNDLWESVNAETRFPNVNVPMYSFGGWYDIFVQGSVNTFNMLQNNGNPMSDGNQKLLMGPWTHSGMMTSYQGELQYPSDSVYDFAKLLALSADWFDHWLKDIDNGLMDEPPVKYYMMSAPGEDSEHGNQWYYSDYWPPAESQNLSFILSQGGHLYPDVPVKNGSKNEYSVHFEYDPANPVPTLGGGNLVMEAGPYDQSTLEERSDVILFETAPFTEEFRIAGNPVLHIYASTDRRDTDFTAKLTDVYPDGRSMLITDGIVRARHRNTVTEEEFVSPGYIYEYFIDLGNTAYCFNPGHKMRLAVSSSNHPRFRRNYNVNEPFHQEDTMKTAYNQVYVEGQYLSELIVPTFDFMDISDGGGTDSDLSRIYNLENSPNPFNPETVISFTMGVSGDYGVYVYDVRGRLVRTISEGESEAGRHSFVWSGEDDSGERVSSGIYMLLVKSGGAVSSRKMVLMK